MRDGWITEDGRYYPSVVRYTDSVIHGRSRIVCWLHLEPGCVRVTRMLHKDEIYPDIDTAIAATILKLS